jgi:outer membrane protein
MRLSCMFVLSVCVWAPASAYAQTLQDAAAAAYRNNPTMAEARLGVRAARENRVQARAGYLPQIDATAEYGVRRSETDEVNPLGGANFHREEDLTPGSASLRAVGEIYTGGRRRAQSQQARASVNSAQEGLRLAEQRVLLATVTAYSDVLRDEEIVRIRRSYTEGLGEDLHGAQRRLDVGDVTRTDVAQAQARLARAEAGELVAQANLQGSRGNYEAVVGEAPGTLAPVPAPPAVPGALDEALQNAERANPRLLQARLDEESARAQVGIERSALRPDVAVIGALNHADNQSAIDDRSDSAQLTARLAVPLYEGGFNSSRVRQSRINVERAQQRTESLRREILSDVVSAWHDLAAARQVVDAARVQLQADEAALSGVRREQGLGLRSTLDVLNAQQELLDSRLSLARAERDAFVGAFELLTAIGALEVETFGLQREAAGAR